MPGTRLPDLTPALAIRRPIRDVSMAIIATGVVVVAASWLSDAARRGAFDPGVADTLSYVVVWAPFLAAVVVGCAGMRAASVRDRLALRAKPIDIAWGLGGGLFARAVVLLATVAITGRTGLGSQPALDGGPHGLQAVAAILFPVVLGPVIEELFFRGYLQRAIEAACRAKASARVATTTAIGVSASLFAAMHVIVEGGRDVPATLTLAIGTLLFGVVAGAIVARTGRLTGAIVAHVVFNAIAVALTWPY